MLKLKAGRPDRAVRGRHGKRPLRRPLLGTLLAALSLAVVPGIASAAPADGAGGLAGRGHDTTRPRSPVRISTGERAIRSGRIVRIRGANGLGASGPIQIAWRPAGSRTWHTRARIEANRDGRFRVKFRVQRSGFARAVDHLGRVSRKARVTVRSVVHLQRPARTVKLGDRLRLAGKVRPRGVRRVKIRIRGAGRTAVVKTRANGRFGFRWKPRRAGDVRITALAVPDRHAKRSHSRRRHSSALRPGGASFYGPGLYGNGVACGGVLTPGTIGVANRTLPCGTKVKIQYGRKLVTARVIDRGPYGPGRDWDLTEALRNRLGFGGVGTVWTNR